MSTNRCSQNSSSRRSLPSLIESANASSSTPEMMSSASRPESGESSTAPIDKPDPSATEGDTEEIRVAAEELPRLLAKLPQELIEFIVDYFHDDHETLRSWCLVSKSMLYVCRYHLFQKFLIDWQQRSGEDSTYSLDDFSRRLESMPHCGTFIRHLVIQTFPSGGWKGVDSRTLLRTLNQLKRLRTLVLRYLFFNSLREESQGNNPPLAESTVPNVDGDLHLDYMEVELVKFSNIQTFYTFLGLFSTIQYLDIESPFSQELNWEKSQLELKSVAPAIRPFPSIKKLGISLLGDRASDSYLYGALNHILVDAEQPLRSIRLRVHYNLPSSSILQQFFTFLRNISATIETFEMKLNTFHIPLESAPARKLLDTLHTFPISTFIAVRHLSVFFGNISLQNDLGWEGNIVFLTSSSILPSVKTITISILSLSKDPQLSDLDQLRWHALDQALSMFKGLRVINFAFSKKIKEVRVDELEAFLMKREDLWMVQKKMIQFPPVVDEKLRSLQRGATATA